MLRKILTLSTVVPIIAAAFFIPSGAEAQDGCQFDTSSGTTTVFQHSSGSWIEFHHNKNGKVSYETISSSEAARLCTYV